MRNYAKGGFSLEGEREDGFSFQNLVFNEVRKEAEKNGGDVHFWRTKNGAEVDLVIETGNKAIPIEVKWSALKKPAPPRSLRSFIERYIPEKAFVINRELEEEIKLGKTDLYFKTVYSLLNGGSQAPING